AVLVQAAEIDALLEIDLGVAGRLQRPLPVVVRIDVVGLDDAGFRGFFRLGHRRSRGDSSAEAEVCHAAAPRCTRKFRPLGVPAAPRASRPSGCDTGTGGCWRAPPARSGGGPARGTFWGRRSAGDAGTSRSWRPVTMKIGHVIFGAASFIESVSAFFSASASVLQWLRTRNASRVRSGRSF